MKSQKMYHTGRLRHGHSHEFVRMRRTGAIPHMSLDAASFPDHFVRTLHISQARMIPIQSLHQQVNSNDQAYKGRR